MSVGRWWWPARGGPQRGVSAGSPRLSVVIVAYNMARELPRTLQSLAPVMQLGIQAKEYEIIVMDNGSTVAWDEGVCRRWCPDLRIQRVARPTPSPVAAINQGLALTSGDLIGVWIDGARLASPGLLATALAAARMHQRPVIGTIGFHLGPDLQRRSIQLGYNQARENALLASVRWEEDGYRLFENRQLRRLFVRRLVHADRREQCAFLDAGAVGGAGRLRTSLPDAWGRLGQSGCLATGLPGPRNPGNHSVGRGHLPSDSRRYGHQRAAADVSGLSRGIPGDSRRAFRTASDLAPVRRRRATRCAAQASLVRRACARAPGRWMSMSRQARRVAPVAIGGVGGSGTRLIAQLLMEVGFYLGDDLNEANDTLWFTLLFKRPEILRVAECEFAQSLDIFIARMTGGGACSAHQAALVRRLAASDRAPQHPSDWLRLRPIPCWPPGRHAWRRVFGVGRSPTRMW